jgi:magnesium chelatase accessory protein
MATIHQRRFVERDWPLSEHSRFVDLGGIHWHVQIMGKGPPLLLLHGTGASTHSFRALMPLLADHFTVVAPDLPGHAFSDAPSSFEPSLPITAAALNELLWKLKIKPEIAIGHSAGAALIARMVLDRSIEPRLLVGLGAALVPFRGVARTIFPHTARLLAVASKVVDFRVTRMQSVWRLLEQTGSSLDDEGIELYRRLSERPSHVAAVLSMMASWDLDPLYADLPQLKVPFVLIAGQNDRAVPVAQQREAAARIPNAQVIVVEGVGHLLHEEKADVIARIIFDALESHERTVK